MKILQVVPYFPPAYSFGGPVALTYKISLELVKRGHYVVVYTTDVKDLNSRLRVSLTETINGIRVFRFRTFSFILFKKLKILLTPELLFYAIKNLKEFDIIHLHEYTTFQNIVLTHYAKKYKIPYILQAHGSLPKVGSYLKLKKLYDYLFGYRILNGASKVIALNQSEALHYRFMGIPKEKIVIIPNGIDLAEYVDPPTKGLFKSKFNIPEEMKIILYLGRITKTKGIDLLIKSYARLKHKMNIKDAVLVIVGPDDKYLKEAKDLVRSLEISESVFFTGFISKKHKLEALVDAEVFVTPSFYGFPITFLEACAMGKPIITTSMGDKLEWINNEVGYVTKPNEEELSKAIYKIIYNKDLYKKFSRNCLKIVKNEFSIEKVTSKFEVVYRKVLNN